MAGDWIKMRSDIYRDPKVSVIAESLMEQGGLLGRYVSQLCQRDMAVTRNVIRNATVGALVSVWGVMRQRGKRYGDDLVCDGVTSGVLDDVADMPGIGDAMERAGWVEQTDGGIVFRRFFEEHNVDPTDRAKASNAERQRRYRERAKEAAANAGDGDVTRNATVTPREEKRREEKDKKNSSSLVAPSGVQDETWQAFLKVRKAHKAPMSELALAGIRREADAAGWTLDAALQECATRGWRAFKAEWVADKKVTQSSGIGRFV